MEASEQSTLTPLQRDMEPAARNPLHCTTTPVVLIIVDARRCRLRLIARLRKPKTVECNLLPVSNEEGGRQNSLLQPDILSSAQLLLRYLVDAARCQRRRIIFANRGEYRRTQLASLNIVERNLLPLEQRGASESVYSNPRPSEHAGSNAMSFAVRTSALIPKTTDCH